MTDRLKGAVVVFDRDIREDDAEAILMALRMVKGVMAVTPSVSSAEDWMNQARVKGEIRDKLYAAIREVPG